METNTFKVEIKLGNDAMQTPEDVADALEKVARELRQDGWRGFCTGGIRDINGNTVGHYSTRDEGE
jgi:hypothetical protein